VTDTRRGRGRPRHSSVTRDAATAREQILDAAAQMFSEQGYKAVSTREIAAAVGLKQASLYYHFPSKQDILADLLAGTVKPSLSFATRLARSGEPPHIQLYALSSFDIALLAGGRWNIGALYALPELRADQFERFRRDRSALQRAYARRISQGAKSGLFRVSSTKISTALVFTLAESVISMRSNGVPIDATLPDTIATACLRLLQCDEDRVAEAVREAKRLCAAASSPAR
jgi:AcrR family transcriptional regulator